MCVQYSQRPQEGTGPPREVKGDRELPSVAAGKGSKHSTTELLPLQP